MPLCPCRSPINWAHTMPSASGYLASGSVRSMSGWLSLSGCSATQPLPWRAAMASMSNSPQFTGSTCARSCSTDMAFPSAVHVSELHSTWFSMRRRPSPPEKSGRRAGVRRPSQCFSRHSHCSALALSGNPCSTQRYFHGRPMRVALAPPCPISTRGTPGHSAHPPTRGLGRLRTDGQGRRRPWHHRCAAAGGQLGGRGG